MGLEEFLLQRKRKAGLEKGLEKGRIAKSRTVVVNMIRQTAFSDEQIADLAEVTIAFVTQVH